MKGIFHVVSSFFLTKIKVKCTFLVATDTCLQFTLLPQLVKQCVEKQFFLYTSFSASLNNSGMDDLSLIII